jgi:hypothetical protein
MTKGGGGGGEGGGGGGGTQQQLMLRNNMFATSIVSTMNCQNRKWILHAPIQ